MPGLDSHAGIAGKAGADIAAEEVLEHSEWETVVAHGEDSHDRGLDLAWVHSRGGKLLGLTPSGAEMLAHSTAHLAEVMPHQVGPRRVGFGGARCDDMVLARAEPCGRLACE